MRHACALPRRSGHLDIHGLAAGVCRHEFLLVACKLFTTENFSYYETLLRTLLQRLDAEGQGQLQFMFLDIACQFQKWWGRCADFSMPAVGACLP